MAGRDDGSGVVTLAELHGRVESIDVRLGIVAQEVYNVNTKLDTVLKLAERVETLEKKVGPMHAEWLARLAVQTWLSGMKGKVIAVMAIGGGVLTIAGGAVTLAQAILGET